jgi:hypothetical protein
MLSPALVGPVVLSRYFRQGKKASFKFVRCLVAKLRPNVGYLGCDNLAPRSLKFSRGRPIAICHAPKFRAP